MSVKGPSSLAIIQSIPRLTVDNAHQTITKEIKEISQREGDLQRDAGQYHFSCNSAYCSHDIYR
jgi:hypothetical protein